MKGLRIRFCSHLHPMSVPELEENPIPHQLRGTEATVVAYDRKRAKLVVIADMEPSMKAKIVPMKFVSKESVNQFPIEAEDLGHGKRVQIHFPHDYLEQSNTLKDAYFRGDETMKDSEKGAHPMAEGAELSKEDRVKLHDTKATVIGKDEFKSEEFKYDRYIIYCDYDNKVRILRITDLMGLDVDDNPVKLNLKNIKLARERLNHRATHGHDAPLLDTHSDTSSESSGWSSGDEHQHHEKLLFAEDEEFHTKLKEAKKRKEQALKKLRE